MHHLLCTVCYNVITHQFIAGDFPRFNPSLGNQSETNCNWRYIIKYNDKTLTCRDCGTSFAFTASEQTFFAEKGFTNEPSRCPGCRSSHRNSGNNSGGSRGGYNENRTMHDVVCAECGRNTQVPFLPSNDRPVYCSDCFKNHNPRNR